MHCFCEVTSAHPLAPEGYLSLRASVGDSHPDQVDTRAKYTNPAVHIPKLFSVGRLLD